MARPQVVVFTRDLRVRDHPALYAAARAGPVVPLFVVDPAVLGSPLVAEARRAYLAAALAHLDAGLRRRGGLLVVHRGAWVDEVVAVVRHVDATVVHLARDHSPLARRRRRALRARLASRDVTLRTWDHLTVVPPGALAPTGGDHFRVFTPYFRRWRAAPWRPVLPAPRTLRVPPLPEPGDPDPLLGMLPPPGAAPARLPGGEDEARARLRVFLARGLARYAETRDRFDGHPGSGLSADLHFGCLSPLEVAARATAHPAGEAFVRQLCWRDFFAQVLAARPEAAWSELRGPTPAWRGEGAEVAAWRDGRTGVPLVDAAMRQLRTEAFMPNRARLVTASFLTRTLGVDWRLGARHFLAHLVDGDVASNNLSWQWVAGTGTDTNPYRTFSPRRQAERFDPEGAYVRRWVPELADLRPPELWDPPPLERARRGYPPPVGPVTPRPRR